MVELSKKRKREISIFTYLFETIVTMGTLLASFYIFKKSIQYTPQTMDIFLSMLWCLALALFRTFRPDWIPSLAIRPLIYVLSFVFILTFTKLKLDTVISAYFLSIGFSYAILYIAGFIAWLITIPLASNENITDAFFDLNKPLFLMTGVMICALQLLLSYLFFRIKRFQNGFPFLFKRYAAVLALIVTGAVLFFATWISVSDEYFKIVLSVAGIIIIGIGIYIWVKRGIKMFYRKKQKEHSIEILEQELTEQKAENYRLAKQNDTIRTANHKIQHRLAALERAVISMSDVSIEAGEELAITLEDIKRTAKDYQADINQLEVRNNLPSTKIKMLDNLFRNFSLRFISSKIDFKLNVNGSIPYMVEKVIEQGKLETMIGDHLQNALIAVSASDNTFRSIWAIIGMANDCYEFSVYDSGIPFEVDTLVRLGAEQVTTHLDDGGSGIGFMTTFQTMKEYDASLIINEKAPSKSDYTKSITIRFDGNCQFIIETYRPYDLLTKSDRYTIVSTL